MNNNNYLSSNIFKDIIIHYINPTCYKRLYTLGNYYKSLLKNNLKSTASFIELPLYVDCIKGDNDFIGTRDKPFKTLALA